MITRVDVRKKDGEFYFYLYGNKFTGTDIIINNWNLKMDNKNIYLNCTSRANLNKSNIVETILLQELSIFLVNSNSDFYFFTRSKYIQDFLDKYNIDKIVSLSNNNIFIYQYFALDTTLEIMNEEMSNYISKFINAENIIEIFGYFDSFNLDVNKTYDVEISKNNLTVTLNMIKVESKVNDFIIVRKIDKDNNIYKVLYLNNTKKIEDIIENFNENKIGLFFNNKNYF